MRVKRKSADQKNKDLKKLYMDGKIVKDKNATRNAVQKLRKNNEKYRAIEKQKIADYIKQKRQEEEYRIKENETMKKKRQHEEYRIKEKEKVGDYMKQKRQDEECRIKENKTMKKKRQDEEYRIKENETMKKKRQEEEYRIKENETMKKKRQDEEYRIKEKEKVGDYMKQKRQDEEYRIKENETMKKRRQDEEYRIKENETMKKKRQDEEYRIKEKEKVGDYMKQKRQDEEYRIKENETMKKKRQDEEYRIKENETMKKKRQDEEYRIKEKEKVGDYMKQKRQDEEYRIKENEKVADYKKLKRQDDDYKKKENEQNAQHMRMVRKDPVYRSDEKKKNVEAKRLMRDDESCRESERLLDLKSKKKKMDIDILRSRQIFYNSLIRKENGAELEFIRQRRCTPKFICCCCEGTFFEHYVSRFKREEIESKFKRDFFEAIFNTDSEHICKTCQKYTNKGKVPKLATSTGLEFVPVPACLQNLSSLEERMVAPFINFMQIRPLMHYALNGQLGMKGSVVNIEVEINDMLDVLPRQFDQMQTVQVVLKRHILHKTDYMKETIRPYSVCEALKYLLTTPLYKKYNIQIDQQYLTNYENCVNEEIDFVVDSRDNKILEDEMTGVIDDLGDEVDEEVLLVNRNQETVNAVQTMAPGQGKPPVPWHAVDDLEELSFPKIFCGHPVELPRGASYSDRVKSESRRHDRRSCGPTRVLYMCKKKMEKACLAGMNTCLRKQKGSEKITKTNVLDKEYIDNKIKFDEGYRFLKQVRSSPAYWEAKKKELMAMIRQLGKPDVFLTISAAEKKWPELLQVLAEFNLGKQLTLEEACLLDEKEKAALIQKDPIMCARYFDFKANKFISYLKDRTSVFKDYPLEDKYERVEFQMRGSPHEHIFLWLRNAPKYDSTINETNAQCVAFIDSLMTCRYDPDDELIALQKHIHTHTCYKGLKEKKLQTCRFHYPRPVLPRTMILIPLVGDEVVLKESLEKDFTRINNYMVYLYKQLVEISFEELLRKLDMEESRYILALRSSIKEQQVFLKRSSLEVGINSYNRTMLHLFESNMDLQFVLNEYGLASYIINYVAKSDAGISKFIKRAAEDADCKNLNIREKFRNIINAFINCNLMSAQEASYHALSLPLSKSSRVCVYINTSPIAERVRMLKMHKNLQKLMADSTDVFMENLLEKYAVRPEKLEDVCLADFAACYFKISSSNHLEQDRNEDEEVQGSQFKHRKKPAIIRYRRYKLQQDPPNYYREQVLLFAPWRKEVDEVENQNCNEIYISKHELIEKNREKYSIIDEDRLEAAIDQVNEDCLAAVNEEIDNFEKQKLSSGQEVNILEQDGREVPKKKELNRFVQPQRISEIEVQDKVTELNVGQKEFVMHVLHWLKIRQEPLRIFLSGSAGVGKSTVIKALYHSVTHYYDNLHGKTFDKIFVLLCAPSGKAAFLINGVTLHTAFALPVTQVSGNMPELASDIANTIREKLMYVKLLIIDEVSMVGSTLFSRVDTRLRQITGINQSFGGISVICVGDLMQLPPVMDSVIYKMPPSHEMCELFEHNPLWEEFRYYELWEIMRQKNEANFIIALNNLAVGKMTDDDVKLIKSREKKEGDVPKESIYLYAENVHVDSFNEKKIDEHNAVEYISEAEDKILGRVSESTRNSVLNALKKKKTNVVNGLPGLIRFKIGIKYMITYNIDVEDGLVNGACGLLEFITFAPNTSDQPKIIWMNFFNDVVGRKARLTHKNFMESNKIQNHLVPICKTPNVLNLSNKLQHQIVRTQFPLVPAMALTVHKSQGQTYESVCIDFRKSKKAMRRQMLYVALSRVTSLNGLHILGNFRAPKTVNEEQNATLKELKKLKTEKKLTLCYDTLKSEKGSKLVIYQNVCSLKSKWKCITSDQWYSRGHVLIFTETLLKNYYDDGDDCLQMINFKEIFRSNMSNIEKTRGISCFVRSELKNIIKIERTLDHSNNGHVELITFQLDDYTIIAGYKSPQLSQSVFERCVRDLLTKQKKLNAFKLILLGDFNYNIFDQNNSFLQNLLMDFSLQSLLPKDCITTDCNTQIDVVFSTVSSLKADTYETFFSYHKPIFVKLDCDGTDKMGNGIIVSSSRDTVAITKRKINDQKLQSPNKRLILDTPPTIISYSSDTDASQDLDQPINNGNTLINVVLNPKGFLLDDHMDQFHSILLESTNFLPQSTLLVQIPHTIQRRELGVPNMQILFAGSNCKEVGHWICVHYNGFEMNVYDSLNRKSLHESCKTYIRNMYGDNDMPTTFHNVQGQTNVYDCGVFAIAFATSIALGQDPTKLLYDINLMRRHVAEILMSKKLTPFAAKSVDEPEDRIASDRFSAMSITSSDTSSLQDLRISEDLNKSNNTMAALTHVLLNPKEYVLDNHMNEFNSILLNWTKFLPQTPLLWQIPDEIQRRALGIPNLQILFAGENATSVGHWICVYYDGFEMNVYDSLNTKKLNHLCLMYIQRMYGDNNMPTIFHNVQQQRNVYDCGVFAIAFATSIALSQDPSKLSYYTGHMRKHVVKILTGKKLKAFPAIIK